MHFKKFGKYTIIKKLTSGGMADILLANDLSPTGFGRFVVIKRTLSKFSENEEFIAMFKNEGKVACSLKHRNITPVYEFGIENNQFFIAMEYISGKNLRELIKKIQNYKSCINIPDSIHIIKEVASGLNHAHNAIDSNTGKPLNLIHRDVSPQNIMLSFDGEIKIIDFGISKIADTNLTRAGHLKGKFSYMSPEQAYGEILDARTDIFCLGIILWELLTNKRLFASKNEMSTLKKVKNCDIPDAQKINPKIPSELNHIIKKALSKNRNFRYSTGAKLEQDLNIFLNKNYPEYSHYDFISLMKKIYRKEIMQEREKLKNYSSEFKKHLHAINIKDGLDSDISLNIPELQTIKQKEKLQKDEPKKTNMKPKNEDQSYFSTHTQQPIKKQDTATHNNTTIVQDKIDITLKNDFSKTFNQKTNLTLDTDNILKNQTDFLHNIQNHSTTSLKNTKSSFGTLYNKKQLLYENLKETQRKKYHTVFTLLFIGSFCIIAYLTFTKGLGIYLKNTKNQSSLSPTQSIVPPPTQINPYTNRKLSTKKIKVYINSTPSAATILINGNPSSKYTPTQMSLPLEKTSITLKKRGHFPKTIKLNPKKDITLHIKLEANKTRKDHQIHFIQ